MVDGLTQTVRTYITRHWVKFSVIAGLVSLGKLAGLAGPFALKYIVDQTTIAIDRSLLIILSLVVAYVFALLLTVLLDELKSVRSEMVVEPLVARVGAKVFERLLNQPQHELIETSFGETVRSIERGLKSLQGLISLLAYSVVPIIIELVIVALIIVHYYEFLYLAILVVGIAIHISFTSRATINIAKARAALNRSEALVSGRFSEALNNHETIGLFSAQQFEARKFASYFHRYARSAISFQLSYSKIRVVQQLIVSGILLALLVNAGIGLSKGQLTAGDFVLINAMALQVLVPLAFVGTIWKELAQYFVDVKILSVYLRKEVRQLDNLKPLSMESTGLTIAFESVSYRAPNKRMVLHDVSFEIPSGSFTAIVGPSGSGKSSILKLIAGLDTPVSGRVLVNGDDLKNISRASYMRALGVVPQHVMLFHGSIAENVRYADRTATDSELANAIQASQLKKKICRFPEGYEATVGERGLKLSGGERQLLGIARALLKKPKALVLDEPSSALDAQTEADFIENFLLSTTAMTRIVVAHRLASISSADNILVINDGALVEQGTHQSLMNLDGLYASLWVAQQSPQPS